MDEAAEMAKGGFYGESGGSAVARLTELRTLARTVDALKLQRPGVVDAYVVVAGLDSDGVFGREATETFKVLTRRYDADGRGILLASGEGARGTVRATPASLETALAAVAERMDKTEDVLILYTTSHGGPGVGVVFKDGDNGYGMVSPERLKAALDEVGIGRRMLLVSACYSGQFVPVLGSAETIVVTAAAADRTSFGCAAGNDWTFFGDAAINGALRTPAPFRTAVDAAFARIAKAEGDNGLRASNPQLFVGAAAGRWLDAIERRVPRDGTAKVGRSTLDQRTAVAHAD